MSNKVGVVSYATPELVDDALKAAQMAYKRWSALSVEERAQILDDAADMLEKERGRFFALLIQEGGKVISDVVAEIITLCEFYYAFHS